MFKRLMLDKSFIKKANSRTEEDRKNIELSQVTKKQLSILKY